MRAMRPLRRCGRPSVRARAPAPHPGPLPIVKDDGERGRAARGGQVGRGRGRRWRAGWLPRSAKLRSPRRCTARPRRARRRGARTAPARLVRPRSQRRGCARPLSPRRSSRRGERVRVRGGRVRASGAQFGAAGREDRSSCLRGTPAPHPNPLPIVKNDGERGMPPGEGQGSRSVHRPLTPALSPQAGRGRRERARRTAAAWR